MAKICPTCGTRNEGTNKFCRKCGASLEVSDAKAVAVATESTREVSETLNNYVAPREMPKADIKRPKKLFIWIGIIAAVAVLIAAVIIGINALSQGDDEPGEPIATESRNGSDGAAAAEDSEVQQEEGVNDAYANILLDNESAIKQYSRQSYSTDKCIVISDISGDSVPELLFFSGDGMSPLKVYTYLDGQAVECSYDNSIVSDANMNTPDGSLFVDAAVDAGTSYMVYTGKNEGIFYIACRFGNEISYYNSIRYTFNGAKEITADKVITNIYGPNDDHTGEIDEYYLNDSKVSLEKGTSELKSDREDMGRLLMYKGYVRDMKVFEATKEKTSEAMTFDEALAACR